MASDKQTKNLAGRIYLAVWRWHFWAGLLITPFIMLLSVTGMLYLFKPQLEPMIYQDLYFVPEVREQTVPFQSFEKAVNENFPDLTLRYISLEPDPKRSWEGFLRDETSDGESFTSRRVLFDPYSGTLLGSQEYHSTFFRVVLNLHRNLLIGLPGRLFTETATCWGIISVLSGIFLWWSRNKGGIRGVWLPRWRGSLKAILRDWHAVSGIYLAMFILTIMLTGLLFTRIWGTAWLAGNAFTGGLPDFYINHPHSVLPETDDAPPERITIDRAYATAMQHYDFSDKSHSIAVVPPGDDHAFEIGTDITKPLQGLAITFIDAYSGETILHETGADLPWRTHLTLLFYPIHTGTIGGLATQLLALLACLILIGLSVTGVWLWWIRRPKGKLGTLPKPPPRSVPSWIVWTTVALAFLLPTVGLTLLATCAVTGLKSMISKPAR